MATLNTGRTPGGVNLGDDPQKVAVGAVDPKLRITPETYTSIGDLVGTYAKPDNRELLIKTYGDQGITGFLKLTGAVNAAATQDEVQYWEEGRRHKLVTGTITGNNSIAISAGAGIRANDVLMSVANGGRFFCSAPVDTNGAADEEHDAVAYTVSALDGGTVANESSAEFIVLGNLYKQGSDQPSAYMEPELIKRVNPS